MRLMSLEYTRSLWVWKADFDVEVYEPRSVHSGDV